jgi:hypothetical protein
MRRTAKLLGSLFALDICLFVLSGVPAFRNAKHGIKDVIGGIGWFGFLVTTLVLIVIAVWTLVSRGIAARRTA